MSPLRTGGCVSSAQAVRVSPESTKRYLDHPKAGKTERNLLVRGVDTHPSIFLSQMAANHRQHGKSEGFVKAYAGVLAFEDGVFDPSDPDDIEAVADLTEAYLRSRHEGHRALLYVQNDSGHLHVHWVVDAVHPQTGRSVKSREFTHSVLAEHVNEALRSHGFENNLGNRAKVFKKRADLEAARASGRFVPLDYLSERLDEQVERLRSDKSWRTADDLMRVTKDDEGPTWTGVKTKKSLTFSTAHPENKREDGSPREIKSRASKLPERFHDLAARLIAEREQELEEEAEREVERKKAVRSNQDWMSDVLGAASEASRRVVREAQPFSVPVVEESEPEPEQLPPVPPEVIADEPENVEEASSIPRESVPPKRSKPSRRRNVLQAVRDAEVEEEKFEKVSDRFRDSDPYRPSQPDCGFSL